MFSPAQAPEALRLDKWLWAARFYKTRSLATEAISAGHVHCNGSRCKPSRDLKVGDRLVIQRPGLRVEVEVLHLSPQRGPACVAQGLYRETDASRQARERDHANATPHPRGERPTKRERRQLERLRSAS